MKPRLLPAVVTLTSTMVGGAGCQHPMHTAAGAGACEPELAPVGGQQVRGCLTAADQASDGTGVTVAAVDIRGASGWIVLHTNDGGEPGPRIGLVPVRQGRSTNVLVPATGRLATGNYWPMLHLDAGVQGAYEFPGGPDVPVVDSQGMVMRLIHVTVHR